jgi:alkylation response protein AidB-like acyl-CoA dehydrogenase
VSVVVDVQNTLIINAFVAMATDAQKEEYLPRLATKSVASFCLSEWGSGSDAFALKTAAVPDGDDHYRINGTKAWITNAGEADVFVCFANADFSKGYKGITAFILERDYPGLVVSKTEDKLGIRSSSTCEINFTDVRVSKDNILGNLGEGYKIAIGTLNEGRIGFQFFLFCERGVGKEERVRTRWKGEDPTI